MTEHIYAHDHPESDARREGGFTLWFTGLSGAGKSTIAHLVGPELERRGHVVEYLDGDTVRTHLSKGLGFSKEDRDTNIERIGWVASRLTRQGGAVIAAAISPYEETRRKARGAGRGVGDVRGGVRQGVGRRVREARRQGPVREGVQGRDQGLHGVDDPYEEPSAPELVVDTEELEPEEAARADRLQARGAAARPGRGAGMSAVVATETLIKPHGGALVDRTGERPDDLDSLEVVTLTAREVSDLDMLASGALSPLEGFMGRADYESVVESMHLASGLPWALPVCLAVDEAPSGDRVALADESGRKLAVLEVAEVYDYDKDREAENCFRTTDEAHPGVARLYAQKPKYLAGRVTVFERPESSFPELALDPRRDAGGLRRARLEARRRLPDPQPDPPGARVPDQGRARDRRRPARPPARRRHEGRRRARPTCASTATASLLDGYYPEDRVLLSAFPAAMRYAGPREAIWHAICRKNYGCSHFIVGRDHAGVGDYYGTYDAQLIFDEFEPHELDIEPMFFEHSFFCKACGTMASAKTCPHGKDDHVFLSGTKVRELLGAGEVPPEEFTRREVAEVLIEAYRVSA